MSITVHLPPGNPLYYYSQIEYFNRDNLIPGIQFVVDPASPTSTLPSNRVEGGEVGLYQYFERALDTMVTPRMKNILTFQSQPPVNPTVQPLKEEEDPPGTTSYIDVPVEDSDDDASIASTNTEPSVAPAAPTLDPTLAPDPPFTPEPKSEVLPGDDGPAVQRLYKGTKLDYFYRNQKKRWV